MVNVKKSRVIKADPQKVWEFINQVERFPEWMPGVVAAYTEQAGGNGPSGLGRKHILKTDTELGKGETVQEIIAWEPPHKITWQHLRDIINGKEMSHAKEIKTTLSITNENGEITFRMIGSWIPAGLSGRLANRLMKRMVARNFDRALTNLENIFQNGSQ